MAVTRTQRFILYSLGKWYGEANKKIKKPLEASISKSVFIDVVKNSGIAHKQKRALYKNLEILEKKKLIAYKHKELRLTEKGERIFNEVNTYIQPYIFLNSQLQEKDPISYTKKVQTIFK